MLFGQTYRPIADFLPRVLANIEGANEAMLASYAMDGAIQFARDSQILSELICIEADPCITSYKLNTKLRPYEVLSIRVFINHHAVPLHERMVYIDGDWTLHVEPGYCANNMRIEVELSVVPYRDSEEVPEVLYEDWVEPIVAYTLARVFSQPDNQWYNNPAAETQMRIYKEFVRKAIVNRISKHRPMQMRLAGRRKL